MIPRGRVLGIIIILDGMALGWGWGWAWAWVMVWVMVDIYHITVRHIDLITLLRVPTCGNCTSNATSVYGATTRFRAAGRSRITDQLLALLPQPRRLLSICQKVSGWLDASCPSVISCTIKRSKLLIVFSCIALS